MVVAGTGAEVQCQEGATAKAIYNIRKLSEGSEADNFSGRDRVMATEYYEEDFPYTVDDRDVQRSCSVGGLLGGLLFPHTRILEEEIHVLQQRLVEKESSERALEKMLVTVLEQKDMQEHARDRVEEQLQLKSEKVQELTLCLALEREAKNVLKQEVEVIKAQVIHEQRRRNSIERKAALPPPLTTSPKRQPDRPVSPAAPSAIGGEEQEAPSLAMAERRSSILLERQREKLEGLQGDLTELMRQKDLQIVMLKNQLSALGETPIEEAVPLREAEGRLMKCMERLMGGDEKAQVEFDKWLKFIHNHPDHQEEEARKEQEWVDRNDDPNRDARRLMRSYVPPDIWSTSLNELKRRGLTEAQATRIWQKKALWLVRVDESMILKMHEVDLRSKFSYQGLDLVELRAFSASLPKKFDNDQTGRKEAWRKDILSKLRSMVGKAEANQLKKTEKRCACYGTGVGPFDPDTTSVPMETIKADSSSSGEGVPSDDLEELRLAKTRRDVDALTMAEDGGPQQRTGDVTSAPATPTMAARRQEASIQPPRKAFSSEATVGTPSSPCGAHAQADGASPRGDVGLDSPRRPVGLPQPKPPVAGGLMAELGAVLKRTKRPADTTGDSTT